MKSEVKVISEAAMNHFGSPWLMMESIIKSIESGADFVKFQLIDINNLYALGEYEYGKYDINEIRRLRQDSSLDFEEFKKISLDAKKKYSKNLVTATPFDIESLENLLSLNPPFIKIASGDNNYLELIDLAASTKIPLIISTGMSTIKQIDNLVNLIQKKSNNIVLMHCVAEYPHNLENSLLGSIDFFQDRYGLEIGFSDHTLGSSAAVIAATKGVKWFEKHFTLSRKNGGVDFGHSLEPDELFQYCLDVKSVSKAIKGIRKDPSEEEILVAKRARRGVYVNKNLSANDVLKKEDLIFLRPEQDFPLEDINKIIGSKLKSSIKKGDVIKKSDIS